MARSPAPLSLRIENFRAIRSTVLTIRPGVNILIGPNGSGKTCLLAGLKFVRDMLSEGVGMAMAKGGGPRRNYHRGQHTIRFSLDHPVGTRAFRRKKVPMVLRWSISISRAGPDAISMVAEETVSLVSESDAKLEVFRFHINRTDKVQAKAKFELSPERQFGANTLAPILGGATTRKARYALVEALAERARRDVEETADRSALPTIAAFDGEFRILLTRLTNINEYNILPDVARQATDQLPYAEVSPSGAGLSEVIDALRNSSVHRLRTSRVSPILPWRYFERGEHIFDTEIRPPHLKRGQLSLTLAKITNELSQAVHSISGLSTAIDPTNGKRFVLFEAGEQRFVPEEISDGTIKWLAILVTIFVPFSSVYVLEEPENFLHPWMQQQLIRIMREQSQEHDTFFLITTHSATILNVAQAEEIAVVSQGESGTVSERLSDREQIASVLSESQFGLGDLWVSGVLGAVPGGDD